MEKVYVVANMRRSGCVLYAATTNKELAEAVFKKLKDEYRGTDLEDNLEIFKFSDEDAQALLNNQANKPDAISRQDRLAEEYPKNLLLSLAEISLYVKGIPTTNITDDIKAGLEYSLSSLSENEQEILRLRYQEKLTFQAIGDHLGITRQRVLNSERQALSKLLTPSRLAHIRYGKQGYTEHMAQRAEEQQANFGHRGSRIPLDELGITARSLNALKRKGYDMVADIVSLTKKEISAIRSLGTQSIIEIAETLEKNGFYNTAWSTFLTKEQQ